ncbi:uncharacterized protein EV420DRAFT_1757971 [Desarmillaria tabescens]|uniref:Uncharacterized protein n=1 Tax=Armillaria tabescens TaxID=1929756 RepID=A0AA39NRF6_ARMTA|nr:uncharacterized protein EV420DRAFT_1757971 [Desarmillaria tabescens]KAK0470455.1 hypothetical protein EV420DRAFT_1757971 [Desarmillaria tabescens]
MSFPLRNIVIDETPPQLFYDSPESILDAFSAGLAYVRQVYCQANRISLNDSTYVSQTSECLHFYVRMDLSSSETSLWGLGRRWRFSLLVVSVFGTRKYDTRFDSPNSRLGISSPPTPGLNNIATFAQSLDRLSALALLVHCPVKEDAFLPSHVMRRMNVNTRAVGVRVFELSSSFGGVSWLPSSKYGEKDDPRDDEWKEAGLAAERDTT